MKLNFTVKLPSDDLNVLQNQDNTPNFNFEMVQDPTNNEAVEQLQQKSITRKSSKTIKLDSVYMTQLEKIKDYSVTMQNEIEATNLWVNFLKPDNIFNTENRLEKQKYENLCKTLENQIESLKSISNFVGLRNFEEYQNYSLDFMETELKTLHQAFQLQEAELKMKDAKLSGFQTIEEQNNKLIFQNAVLESNLIAMKAKLEATLEIIAQKSDRHIQLLPSPEGRNSLQMISNAPQTNSPIYQAKYEEAQNDIKRLQLKLRKIERELNDKNNQNAEMIAKIGGISTLQKLIDDQNSQINDFRDKMSEVLQTNERLNKKIEKLKANNAEMFAAQQTNHNKRVQMKEHIDYLEANLKESQKKNQMLIDRLKESEKDESEQEVETFTENYNQTGEKNNNSFLSQKQILERKLDELDKKCRLYQSEAQNHQKNNNSVSRQYEDLEKEFEKKCKQIANSEKQLSDKNDALFKLKLEFEKIIGKNTSFNDQLQLKIEECEKTSWKIKDLEGKIVILENQNHNLRDTLDSSQTENLNLSSQISDLNRILCAQVDEIVQLKQDFKMEKEKTEHLSTLNISLSKENEKLEEIIRKLTYDLRNSNDKNKEQAHLLLKSNGQLSQLNEAHKKIIASNDQLKQKIIDQDKVIQELLTKVSLLKKDCGNFNAEIEKLNQIIANLRKNNQELENQRNDFKKRLENFMKENKEKQKEIENARKMINDLKIEINRIQRLLDEMNINNSDLKNIISTLKIENKILENNKNQLENELIEKCKNFDDEKSKLRDHIQDIISSNQQYKTNMSNLDFEMQNRSKYNEDLNRKIKELQDENDRLQLKINDIKNEYEKQMHENYVICSKLNSIISENNQHLEFLKQKTQELEEQLTIQQKNFALTMNNKPVRPISIAPIKKRSNQIQKSVNQPKNEALLKQINNLESVVSEKHKQLIHISTQKVTGIPQYIIDENEGLKEQLRKLEENTIEHDIGKAKMIELEHELDSARNALTEYQTKPYIILTPEIKSAFSENNRLKTEMDDILKLNTSLSAENDLLKKEIDEFQKKAILNKERLLNELFNSNPENSEAVQKLKDELIMQLNDFELIQAQLFNVQEELRKAQFEIEINKKQHEHKIENLKDEFSFEKNRLEEALIKKRGKIIKLKKIISDFEDEIQVLKKKPNTQNQSKSVNSKNNNIENSQMALDLKKLTNENSALTSETLNLKKNLKDLQKMFEESRKPINLNDELREKIKSLSKITDDLILAKSENEKSQSKINSLETLLRERENKLIESQSLIDKHQSQSKIGGGSSNKEELILKLEQENNNLKNKLQSQIMNDQKSQENDIAKKDEENITLKNQLEKISEESQKLKNDIHQKLDDEKLLKTKFNSLEDELKSNVSLISKLRLEVNNKDNESKSTSEISKLNAKIEGLKNALINTENKLIEFKKQNPLEQIKQLIAKNTEINDEMAKQDKEIIEKDDKIDELENELKSIKKSLNTHLKSQNTNDINAPLKKELLNLTAEVKSLNDEINNIKQEKEESIKKIKDMNDNIVQNNAIRFSEIQAENIDLKLELKNLKTQMNCQSILVDEFKIKERKVKSTPIPETNEINVDELQNNLDLANQKITRQNEELSKFKESGLGKNDEIAYLEIALKKINYELIIMQKKLDLSNSENEKMQKSIRYLENEFEKSQNTCQILELQIIGLSQKNDDNNTQDQTSNLMAQIKNLFQEKEELRLKLKESSIELESQNQKLLQNLKEISFLKQSNLVFETREKPLLDEIVNLKGLVSNQELKVENLLKSNLEVLEKIKELELINNEKKALLKNKNEQFDEKMTENENLIYKIKFIKSINDQLKDDLSKKDIEIAGFCAELKNQSKVISEKENDFKNLLQRNQDLENKLKNHKKTIEDKNWEIKSSFNTFDSLNQDFLQLKQQSEDQKLIIQSNEAKIKLLISRLSSLEEQLIDHKHNNLSKVQIIENQQVLIAELEQQLKKSSEDLKLQLSELMLKEKEVKTINQKLKTLEDPKNNDDEKREAHEKVDNINDIEVLKKVYQKISQQFNVSLEKNQENTTFINELKTELENVKKSEDLEKKQAKEFLKNLKSEREKNIILSSQLRNLQSNFDDLKSDIIILENYKQLLLEKIEKSQKDASISDEKIKELQNQLEDIENKSKIDQQNLQLSNELKKLSDEESNRMATEVQSLMKKINSLKKKVENPAERMIELEKENEYLHDKIQYLEKEITQNCEKMNNLQDFIQKLENDLNNMKISLVLIENEKRSAENNANFNDLKLNFVKAENENKSSEIEKLLQKINELENINNNHLDTISKCQHSNKILDGSLNLLKTNFIQLHKTQKMEKVQKSVNIEKEVLNNNQTKNNNFSETKLENEQLSEQEIKKNDIPSNEQLNDVIENLKNKIKNMESEIQNEHNKISELKLALSLNEIRFNTISQEKVKNEQFLDTKIDQMSKESSEIEARFIDFSNENSKLKIKNDLLQRKLEVLHLEHNEFVKNHQNCASKMNELEEKLRNSLNKNYQIQIDFNKTQNEKELLEKMNNYIKQELDFLQNQLVLSQQNNSTPKKDSSNQIDDKSAQLSNELINQKLLSQFHEKRCKNIEVETINLQKKIDDLLTGKKDSENNIDDLNRTILELKAAVREKEFAVDSLEFKIKTLETNFESLREKSQSSVVKPFIQNNIPSVDQDLIASLDAKNTFLIEKQEQLKQNFILQKNRLLADKKQEEDILHSRINDLLHEIQTLKEQLSNTNKQITDNLEDFDIFKDKEKLLKSQNEEIIKRLKNQVESLKNRLKEKNSSLSEIELQNEKMNRRKDSMNIRVPIIDQQEKVKKSFDPKNVENVDEIEVDNNQTRFLLEKQNLIQRINQLSFDLKQQKENNEKLSINFADLENKCDLIEIDKENLKLTINVNNQIAAILQAKVDALEEEVQTKIEDNNKILTFQNESQDRIFELELILSRKNAQNLSKVVDKEVYVSSSLQAESKNAQQTENISSSSSESISSEIKEQIKKIPALTTQNIVLKSELDLAKQRINDFESQLNQKLTAIEKLNLELENLNNGLKNKKTENEQIDDTLNQFYNDNIVLKAKCKALEEELDFKVNQVAQMQEEISNLGHSFNEKCVKIHNLEAVLKRKDANLKKLTHIELIKQDESEKQVKNELIDNLIEKLQKGLFEKNDQINRLNKEIVNVKFDEEEKVEHIQDLNVKLAKLKDELAEKNHLIENMKIEMLNQISNNQNQALLTDKIKNELNNSLKTIQSLQFEVNSFKKNKPPVDINFLNKSENQVESKNDNQLIEQTSKINSENELALKISEMNLIKEENSELFKKLEKMQVLLNNSQSLPSDKEKIAQLEAKIVQLQSQLKLLTEESSSSLSEIENLNSKLNRFKKTLNNVESKQEDILEIERLKDIVEQMKSEMNQTNELQKSTQNSYDQKLQIALLENKNLNERIFVLEKQCQDSNSDDSILTAQINQLKIELASQSTNNHSTSSLLRTEIEELKNTIELLKSELNKKNDEHSKNKSHYISPSNNDSSLDYWHDVVHSLTLLVKLSKSVLENEKGEKVVDAAEFSDIEQTVIAYSQNSLLQIEKIKKFLKEIGKIQDEKTQEIERLKTLINSMENNTINEQQFKTGSIDEVLSSIKVSTNYFIELSKLVSSDQTLKIAQYEVISNDSSSYLETMKKYLKDQTSYFSILKNQLIQQNTDYSSFKNLEADFKQKQIKSRWIEELRDIDNKILKSNELLLEGITIIGKNPVFVKERYLIQSDNIDQLIEQINLDFDQNLTYEQILLNDIKILCEELKNPQKKAINEENKQVKYEISSELEIFINTFSSLFVEISNILTESQTDKQQSISYERKSLKVHTNQEDCYKGLNESGHQLIIFTKQIFARVKDLKTENVRLKSIEKEFGSTIAKNDLIGQLMSIFERSKNVGNEMNQIINILEVGNQLSVPKIPIHNDNPHSFLTYIEKILISYATSLNELQQQALKKKSEIHYLKNFESEQKSAKNKDDRLKDFMEIAKEEQNINYLARKVLNPEIGKYINEFTIQSKNSDDLIDIFFSLNKSTAKYLESIHAKWTNMHLEIEKLKLLEKESSQNNIEIDKPQNLDMSSSKNILLLEKIKNLEQENSRLQVENEHFIHVDRSTSHVKSDYTKITHNESSSMQKTTGVSNFESLKNEHNSFKNQMIKIMDTENENAALKMKLKSMQSRMSDFEIDFDKTKRKSKLLEVGNDFSLNTQKEKFTSKRIINTNTFLLENEIKTLKDKLVAVESTGSKKGSESSMINKLLVENKELNAELMKLKNVEMENDKLKFDLKILKKVEEELRNNENLVQQLKIENARLKMQIDNFEHK